MIINECPQNGSIAEIFSLRASSVSLFHPSVVKIAETGSPVEGSPPGSTLAHPCPRCHAKRLPSGQTFTCSIAGGLEGPFDLNGETLV